MCASFNDSWRSGGIGRGPYVLKPRTNAEVPLTAQAISSSLSSDIAIKVKNFAGTSVFTVDYAGNLTFSGSGIIVVDETITGNLTVGGNSALGNSITNDTVTITAATTLAGSLTVTGASIFNGTTVFNNSTSFALATLFADGQAAAPSIAFASATGLGMYKSAASTLGFAASGLAVFLMSKNTDSQLTGTTAIRLTVTGATPQVRIAFSANDSFIQSSTSAGLYFSGLNGIQNTITGFSSAAIIFGTGEGTGTVTGATARGPGVVGADLAGVNLTIQPGNGTGTGGSGNLIFQTAPVAGSSSTANTMTTRMTIIPSGQLQLTAGQGGIRMGTTTDGDLISANANTNTIGIICSSTAAFSGVNGPFQAFRGITYSDATQVGLISLGAGNPGAGTGDSGCIMFYTYGTGADVVRFRISKTGNLATTQGISPVTTTPVAFTLTTAAHLNMVATVEDSSVVWDLSASKQWATGGITTQREFRIIPPTYTAVGASVFSSVALMSVSGIPTASTNVTITNGTALLVSPITSQASNTGGIYSAERMLAGTMTLTGSTAMTDACATQMLRVETLALSGAGFAVTAAAGIYVAAAPTISGGATITNSYSIFADSGLARLDGGLVVGGALNAGGAMFSNTVTNATAYDGTGVNLTDGMLWAVAGGAGGYALSFTQNASGTARNGILINTASTATDSSALTVANSTTGLLVVRSDGNVGIGVTAAAFADVTSQLVILTKITAGGKAGLTLTPGAHTAVVAAKLTGLTVSASTLNVTGAIPAQIFNSFGIPTIAQTGAVTVTTAINVSISAPTVDATGIITSAIALGLGSAVVTSSIQNIASTTYSLLSASTQAVDYLAATQVTAACAVAAGRFGIITLGKAVAGALTVDAAATVYIAGAVAQSGNCTVTNKYSLWIDAGLPRIDSTTANGAGTATWIGVVPGSNTTVQEWLTVDINGTTRYIPAF